MTWVGIILYFLLSGKKKKKGYMGYMEYFDHNTISLILTFCEE